MKKTTLTIVCALIVTGAVFAQGTVNWGSFAGIITAQTNTTQNPPIFGGGAGGGLGGNTAPASSGLIYYYELLYNTNFNGSQATTPTFSQLFGGTWLDTGFTATNSNHVGWLTPVNPNSAAVVPWANGVTNNIMLVGWSANMGTSWATVSNELATAVSGEVFYSGFDIAFFGESVTGYLTPNTSPAFGAAVFLSGPDANGLPINNGASPMQLYIVPVPEPGTIVLAGLGGLSLLLFRRRR